MQDAKDYGLPAKAGNRREEDQMSFMDQRPHPGTQNVTWATAGRIGSYSPKCHA
jgi:hypothetical protein